MKLGRVLAALVLLALTVSPVAVRAGDQWELWTCTDDEMAACSVQYLSSPPCLTGSILAVEPATYRFIVPPDAVEGFRVSVSSNQSQDSCCGQCAHCTDGYIDAGLRPWGEAETVELTSDCEGGRIWDCSLDLQQPECTALHVYDVEYNHEYVIGDFWDDQFPGMWQQVWAANVRVDLWSYCVTDYWPQSEDPTPISGTAIPSPTPIGTPTTWPSPTAWPSPTVGPTPTAAPEPFDVVPPDHTECYEILPAFDLSAIGSSFSFPGFTICLSAWEVSVTLFGFDISGILIGVLAVGVFAILYSRF